MKFHLGLLALAATAYAHAHHDHDEAIPDTVREQLLKKWDQEVCVLCLYSNLTPCQPNIISSGRFPESPASRI